VDTTATYTCCWCGEASVTEVDVSQGMSQRYIEDCQVCCRPMTFFLTFDDESMAATIETEPAD
jgi:hypothetical protein